MAAGLHHPASTWHYNTDKPGCGTSAYQDFKGQDRERNEASQVLKQIEEVNGTALANLQPQVVFIELFLFSQNWV